MEQNTVTLVVALAGLFGTVLAALVSYRQGVLKVTQDLQIEYDKDLRNRRINHYNELWKILFPLGKYPEPRRLSHEQLESLGQAIEQWYFTGGGLFLSERTREHFSDLQDGLRITLEKMDDKWNIQTDDEKVLFANLQKHLDRAPNWKCPEQIRHIATADLAQDDSSTTDNLLYHLRKLGSILRTSMANDVLTRQPTILGTAAAKD